MKRNQTFLVEMTEQSMVPFDREYRQLGESIWTY